jgi:predicted RNase H-like HicB family nuclease
VKKMQRKDKHINSLKPSNEWIAFSQDEEHLIAYGATYDEVVANAEKQGVADLIVVKVPETRIYRVRLG